MAGDVIKMLLAYTETTPQMPPLLAGYPAEFVKLLALGSPVLTASKLFSLKKCKQIINREELICMLFYKYI